MRLDLRALRSFVAVASAGSISSAAHSLHIAQPALSVQIKQLEEQLGAALFDRHPRGVVLTAVGERLLGQALQELRMPLPATDDPAWQKLARSTGASSREEILADIGLGKRLAAVVARRFAP